MVNIQNDINYIKIKKMFSYMAVESKWAALKNLIVIEHTKVAHFLKLLLYDCILYEKLF